MNRISELLVSDEIDKMLKASGWVVQFKNRINLTAYANVKIREYQTVMGPDDYVLFVNQKPVGVTEAKWEEESMLLPYNVFEVETKIIKGLEDFHL